MGDIQEFHFVLPKVWDNCSHRTDHNAHSIYPAHEVTHEIGRAWKILEEVFNERAAVSVEQSGQKLYCKLKELNYPMWCYVEVAEEKYKDFLNLLTEIAKSKQSVSVSALAERAGQFLRENPTAITDLKDLLTEQKGRDSFIEFLKKFEAGIIFELGEEIGVKDIIFESQKSVRAEEGHWLWEKEKAEGELQRLIIDLKITAESRKFGIEGTSLSSCTAAWKDFCRFNIKIPWDLICEDYPGLRGFFLILKEIVIRGEIPQGKREEFLRQLLENAESIYEVIDEPIKILKKAYSYQLSGLNEKEISEVYASMPYSSFTDSQGHYHKNLNGKANEIRKGQMRNKLLDLWREVAGNSLPREWSKINRTPILAMVPQSEEEIAGEVFETVMKSSATEKEIKRAMEYLQSRPAYFEAIKNGREIEAVFREKVIGDKDVLISGNEEVRNELEMKISGDVYRWYPNMRVLELVDEIAKNKYFSGGAYEKLTARVCAMSREEAKRLLLELVD